MFDRQSKILPVVFFNSAPPVKVIVISQASLATLLPVYGPWLIFAVVALESAVIPLPGEMTLIAAALLANKTQELSITSVVIAGAAGAIVGDNLGYWAGRRFGRPLLLRYGLKFHLDQSRLKLGEYLFRRYGGTMVFFGRFVALLRAFAALHAGANKMPWRRFLIFNAAGALSWASLFGFGVYEVGAKAERLAGGLSAVFFGVALVCGFLFSQFLRHNEADLLRRAEAAIADPTTPK